MKWLFVFLSLLFFAAPVSAQDPTPKGTKEKAENLKFQGLRLKGQFKKPDLTYIYKRKGIRSEKILNIPDNFNDEISKGTHQF